MRLFLAVDLDEATRVAVSEIAVTLRAMLHPAVARSTTWVAAANLHITLRFLGETRDEAAAALRLALDRPVRLAPFEVKVGAVGTFPNAAAPRILWVGVRRGGALLEELYNEVQARLTELGVPPEPRPFHPHVTLARFKRDRIPRRARLPNWAAEASEPIAPMLVTELTLFESCMSSRGSTYVAQLRTPLVRGEGQGTRG
ncbi:MAG: RNA 2',3'-cyclic phosphodiesterase [Luteitalea sp.]|nr:RNA 2',3'-cyclic phosphodiesterase [Luteitalea sp.]